MILNIDVSKQWGWVSALALPAFAARADDFSKIPRASYQVSSRGMATFQFMIYIYIYTYIYIYIYICHMFF